MKKGYIASKIQSKLIVSASVTLVIVLFAYYSGIRLAYYSAFVVTCLFAVVINKNTFMSIVNMFIGKFRNTKKG